MTHSGLTWDHPRGYNALAAAASRAAVEGGVRIKWAKQPLEGFESHPIADLAARYDLLVLDHPHIGEAVASDCLVALEDLFTTADIAGWQERTVGPALDSYLWHGRHYALPLDVATQVMAWRRDLVGERPVTWDDVARLSEHAPVAVSISGPHAICTFFSICVSLGEEPRGERLVSDAIAIEALGRMARLSARAPRGTEAYNPIRLLEAMATSDSIALVPLVYGYVNYSRTVRGRHAVAFGEAPVIAAGGRPGSVLGGTGIALTKRARPDRPLLDHLRWLMSLDAQARFIPEHDGQPSARDAWRSDAVNATVGGFYRNTLATVEAAYVRPRHDGYIAFQTEGSAIIRAGILGQRPPATILPQLRDAWSANLAAARQVEVTS